MIIRIWHGWTRPEQADAYERLLRGEIMPHFFSRNIPGFTAIEMLRRDSGEEVEFVVLMRFDSLDAVKAFAGPDYATAVVPFAARALLSRFDAIAQHYEVVESRTA